MKNNKSIWKEFLRVLRHTIEICEGLAEYNKTLIKNDIYDDTYIEPIEQKLHEIKYLLEEEERQID